MMRQQRAETSGQVWHEVRSEQDGRAVPATLVERLLADLRHLASGVDNSGHQVEVACTQAPLMSRHSFTGRRPAFRRPVPVCVPPLCHRPNTSILISI